MIYDEIFDGALKALPESILTCLKNAQHVQRVLYEQHVERMLATQLEHTSKPVIQTVVDIRKEVPKDQRRASIQQLSAMSLDQI